MSHAIKKKIPFSDLCYLEWTSASSINILQNMSINYKRNFPCLLQYISLSNIWCMCKLSRSLKENFWIKKNQILFVWNTWKSFDIITFIIFSINHWHFLEMFQTDIYLILPENKKKLFVLLIWNEYIPNIFLTIRFLGNIFVFHKDLYFIKLMKVSMCLT